MDKINTILFDFDGTMMDTNDVILQSWQHTFQKLTGKTADEKQLIATFGEPLVMTMKSFFGGDDEQVMRNVEIYRSFQKEHFTDLVNLFPGILELVKQLKSREYKLAIVTSRLKRTTLEGVKKFGLDNYFDHIVTAEDTPVHKPDPKPIFIALDQLRAKPEESLMVGDTWMDMVCAKNAGAKSALVSWSLALPKDKITPEWAPDFYLEKPLDLIDYLTETVYSK